MTYIYSKWNQTLQKREILFQVEASDILEADKLFEAQFKINVVKNSSIGCSLIPSVPKQSN